MELSPSREAASCAATELLHSILWSPSFISYSQKPITGPYPEPGHYSSYHPQPTFIRFILMLFTHLYLGLRSGPLRSAFPANNLYAFFFSHVHATCPAPVILLGLISLRNYTGRRVQVMKLLIMQV
jgi:hypothetical protein